jgi:D-alanine-D-alanine ligase
VKKRIIGLTYNLKKEYIFKDSDPPDANAEFDHEDTIGIIAEALGSWGHRVVRIGNVHNLLDNLKSLSVDIVFNISEGLNGRNRESQVPIVLEMAGIPFVGADGLTLGLTLDKVMTKKILVSEAIPTPKFLEVKDSKDIDGVRLKFPLIVKPRYEGSSKGINDNSVVEDLSRLKQQVDWVITTYHQSALIEEFIRGKEFTVAIIGNNPPQVLPLVQIRIDGKLQLDNSFYTFSRIHSNTLDYVCPAEISKKLEKMISDLALRTYEAVECRDFGRVDIRVDKDNNPYVLEINPLPSLSTEDVFMVVAKYLKITYNEIIKRILNSALARYSLLN